MTFLKNTWYVAANASELDEPMVSRKICNEQIVMFRNSDGSVAAIQDRCPHRFVPLSMGKRVGDTCNAVIMAWLLTAPELVSTHRTMMTARRRAHA